MFAEPRVPSPQVQFLNAARVVARTSVTTPRIQLGNLTLVGPGGPPRTLVLGGDGDAVTIGPTGAYPTLRAFSEAYAKNPTATAPVLQLQSGTHTAGAVTLPGGTILQGVAKETTVLTTGSISVKGGNLTIRALHVSDVGFSVTGSLFVEDVFHATPAGVSGRPTFRVHGPVASFTGYEASAVVDPILELSAGTDAVFVFQDCDVEVATTGNAAAVQVSCSHQVGASIRDSRIELANSAPFFAFGALPAAGSVVELTHNVLQGSLVAVMAATVQLREGENTYIGESVINLAGGEVNSDVHSDPQYISVPPSSETTMLQKILANEPPPTFGLLPAYSQITMVNYDLTDSVLTTPGVYGDISTMNAAIDNPSTTKYSFSQGVPVPDLPGMDILQQSYETILGATQQVELITLWRYPETYFLMMLKNAVKAIQDKNVTVRIIFGIYPYPPFSAQDITAFATDLSSVVTSPTAQVKLAMGQLFQLRYATYPWSHCKILVADGSRLITGGENLWDIYWETNPFPIIDCMVQLSGDFSVTTRFANNSWFTLFSTLTSSVLPAEDFYMNQVLVWTLQGGLQTGEDYGWELFRDTFLLSRVTSGPIYPAEPVGAGVTAMMELSDSAAGASIDSAIITMFDNAQQHIKLSQQMLLINPVNDADPIPPWEWPLRPNYILTGWGLRVITGLAGAINRSVPVHLVYSKWSGTPPADAGVSTYTSSVPPWFIKAQIERVFVSKGWDVAKIDQFLVQKICSYDGVRQCVQHDKVVIVDDVVLNGSFNMYINTLSEYSVALEGAAHRERIEQQYWLPRWNYGILQ